MLINISNIHGVKIKKLKNKNKQLKNEIEHLKNKNEKLKSKIFELEVLPEGKI